MEPDLTPPTAEEQAAADSAEADAFAGSFEVEYSDGSPSDPLPEEKPAAAPAPAAAPSPATPAAPAAPAAEPPVVDPFAGVPEPLKALVARIPQLEQDLRSANGRLAALQRERARGAQPPAAPAQREPIPEVERLRNDMPDVADAVNAAFERAMAPAPAPAAPAPAAQQDDDPLSEEAKVLGALHPEWEEKILSTEFNLWLETQPANYRELVRGATSAAPIVHALNGYGQYTSRLQQQLQQQQAAAAEAARLQQQRQARVAGSATPRGAGRPAAQQVETEDDAFLAGFNSGLSP